MLKHAWVRLKKKYKFKKLDKVYTGMLMEYQALHKQGMSQQVADRYEKEIMDVHSKIVEATTHEVFYIGSNRKNT